MGGKCAEGYPEDSRYSWVGWVYPFCAALCIVAVVVFANEEAYPKYVHANDDPSSTNSVSRLQYGDLSAPGK